MLLYIRLLLLLRTPSSHWLVFWSFPLSWETPLYLGFVTHSVILYILYIETFFRLLQEPCTYIPIPSAFTFSPFKILFCTILLTFKTEGKAFNNSACRILCNTIALHVLECERYQPTNQPTYPLNFILWDLYLCLQMFRFNSDIELTTLTMRIQLHNSNDDHL